MFGYVGALRSLSSGRASFSMVFDGYKAAPTELIENAVRA
jgi:translation elongation factor EF-G